MSLIIFKQSEINLYDNEQKYRKNYENVVESRQNSTKQHIEKLGYKNNVTIYSIFRLCCCCCDKEEDLR